MNAMIEIQSKFANLTATDLISEKGKTQNADLPLESPKSELAMYIEMGAVLAAFSGILALVAWVSYSALDWSSSIQRFQEMI